MTAVVDASAIVDFVGGGPRREAVDERLRSERLVWAPHLIDAEVGHALRAAVHRGDLDESRAVVGLDALSMLSLNRADHRELRGVAWSLRHNLSYYDALYVALAAALDAPLITLDARLAAAPGLPAVVECLA